MTKPWRVIAAIITMGVAYGGSSWAAENGTVIPINNGINQLSDAGAKFTIVRALRENFNAHSFDVVTFYVHGNDKWKLIPLFGSYDNGDQNERDFLAVNGGADCMLHDFRLLRMASTNTLRIVTADRDMGDSFVDPNIVHFTVYDLEKNEIGLPGQPSLYFQMVKTTVSKTKYCDVNQAFAKELNLGPKGNFDGP